MSNFGDLKNNALGAMREVAALADDAGAKSLARGLREERIPRLEDERFHLVVLGEFNHGKTTFVNALLGKEVLPTGVTPTTAVIHTIQHADAPRAVAVSHDSVETPVPFESLRSYEVDGTAVADEVRHIALSYPAPFLKDGTVLVDTPGVNDLNEARAEITYGYVPQADAVLFLLDAGQILKQSERSFIREKLLPAVGLEKIFFVINKIDLLDDEERLEALAYARMHLSELGESPRVFAMSAEAGLEGGDSGVGELTDELRHFLEDERGRVVLDSALEATLRAARTLRTGMEIQKHALQLEHGDLQRRLDSLEADLEASGDRIAERQAQLREAISATKAVVRADVMGFAQRFSQELPQEIENADPKELRKHLGGFIEERLRTFAQQEAEELAVRLEKVAEEAIAFVADDARAQAERLRATLGADAAPLDLDVNTMAYDVGVFAVGAFGVTMMMLSNVIVGGALTLAAPLLAFVFRGRADRQMKARAKEEAPKVIREAAEKMAEAFDERIEAFGQKLMTFVTAANEDMMRSIAELVRVARDAQNEGEVALGAFQGSTGMSLAQVHEVEGRLGEMRKHLWANGKVN